MDFRILDIDGHQVLLERIEDEGRWQVIVSLYIDVLERFDEWDTYVGPCQAKEFIASYEEEKARAFLERALIWWRWKSERTGGELLATG